MVFKIQDCIVDCMHGFFPCCPKERLWSLGKILWKQRKTWRTPVETGDVSLRWNWQFAILIAWSNMMIDCGLQPARYIMSEHAPVKKGPFTTYIKFRHVHLVLCDFVVVWKFLEFSILRSHTFDSSLEDSGVEGWWFLNLPPFLVGFRVFKHECFVIWNQKVRNHGFTTNSCEQKHDLTTPIQSTWSPSCTTGRWGLGNPGGLLGKGKPGG